MNHQEARQRELAELYVRGEMSASDRSAFEEHFFGCAECFEEVEALDRMRSAVKEAVAAGEFTANTPAKRSFAAGVGIAAAALFAAIAGWSVLVEQPRLAAEARREREIAKERIGALEKEMAGRELASSSLPVLILEAARDGETNNIRVPSGAKQIALWMEPPPTVAGPFRLGIFTPKGAEIESVGGLARNPQGALAVSIPTRRLPAGSYRARLFGASGKLLAEYAFGVAE
ncbi:MAG: hypothetical protein FJW38_19660 [Acidobacteria bacterium]|nr:hypothetical protein [Acidobacteriota bacterium]